jgi:hypothetical protein
VPKPVFFKESARTSSRFASSSRARALSSWAAGAFELGGGLAQLDLIGRRIDPKQEIAFVDYITVLEADLRERAADLSA